MQGVILDEMRMYVVGAYGNPAWAEVMKRSGRAGQPRIPERQGLSGPGVRPAGHPDERGSRAALQYGVEVEITEEQCVLRGDPACVITVKGQ